MQLSSLVEDVRNYSFKAAATRAVKRIVSSTVGA